VSDRVRLTRQARDDLERLFDFIIERKMAPDGGDLDLAAQALAAIRSGIDTL
jgi:plasmid stabilization system protein ParE